MDPMDPIWILHGPYMDPVWILYGAYMAFATFIWFSFISYVFTSEGFQSKFSSFLGLFEKIIGFVLILLSLQILIYQIFI